MPSCLVGLGSNLGDRHALLESAVERIQNHAQISRLVHSRWRETSPVGGPQTQSAFLNGAVRFETSLSPESLLELLRQIEIDLGRRRGERWGPRTIDLDLLLFDRQVCDTETLVLPHPRMAWRRFVLEPAAEIAGEMVHPTIGWTVAELLQHLDMAPRYVALAGGIGVGKTRLAHALADRMAARQICEQFDLNWLERFYADPASHAWQTELEFLQTRAELLAADRAACGDTQWVVSDFWFQQSVAFAHVWLPSERHREYNDRYEALRHRVTRPKLIVLLDAPVDTLLERVRRRGRPCERHLTAEQLERIRQSVVAEATAPGHGPVLTVNDQDHESMVREVTDAMQSMQ